MSEFLYPNLRIKYCIASEIQYPNILYTPKPWPTPNPAYPEYYLCLPDQPLLRRAIARDKQRRKVHLPCASLHNVTARWREICFAMTWFLYRLFLLTIRTTIHWFIPYVMNVKLDCEQSLIFLCKSYCTWFVIALTEIGTRRILREKADCLM